MGAYSTVAVSRADAVAVLEQFVAAADDGTLSSMLLDLLGNASGHNFRIVDAGWSATPRVDSANLMDWAAKATGTEAEAPRAAGIEELRACKASLLELVDTISEVRTQVDLTCSSWPRDAVGYVLHEIARLGVERRGAEVERDRWAARVRELENRIWHATETLSGEVEVPELNEIRRIRGLELLPDLRKE